MQKLFDILNRIRARGFLLIPLTLVSAFSLIYVLSDAYSESAVFRYFSYTLSAYTLCCLVPASIALYKKIRIRVLENRYAGRYVQDFEWRSIVNAHVSLVINLAFAALKLYMSIAYMSLWFAAIAGYYAVLSLTRFFLLRNYHRLRKIESSENRRVHSLRVYQTCGFSLFALTAALLGAVWQMVFAARSYIYPGVLIYAVAAFAFYSIITAARNLIRVRILDNPIVAAAKLIGFASALVSILALQTAMFATFGTEHSTRFAQYMNAASGTLICFGILALAVMAVVAVRSELAKISSD